MEGTNNFRWLKNIIEGKINKQYKRKKWSDDRLISLLPGCHSVMEVCEALGLRGRNQDVKGRIASLNLDTEHFYILKQSVRNLFRHYNHRDTTSKKIAYVHKKCLEIGIKRGFIENFCHFCKERPTTPTLYHLDIDIYNNTPQNVVVCCKKCGGS